MEEIADGLWAMISTPLVDRTTLSNGGIIRGSREVLTIESFASAEGARWVTDQARSLAGRTPDHVVLTHYHGDHTAGLAGYAGVAPNVYVTSATRDRLVEGGIEDPVQARLLESAQVIGEDGPTEIDLGGRVVRVIPRTGHTDSDLTIELAEPSVVWCGDLVWNGMFPNYMDATPSKLSRSVLGLKRDSETQYVPGHGPMASPSDLETYINVLNHVEGVARLTHSNGGTAEEAADGFRFPESFGEWMLFNPNYYERAIGAWMAELSSGSRLQSS
jgi:glyoxylase-like metal-dependent hydrolase (beta-lactamase superfamily II)